MLRVYDQIWCTLLSDFSLPAIYACKHVCFVLFCLFLYMYLWHVYSISMVYIWFLFTSYIYMQACVFGFVLFVFVYVSMTCIQYIHGIYMISLYQLYMHACMHVCFVLLCLFLYMYLWHVYSPWYLVFLTSYEHIYIYIYIYEFACLWSLSWLFLLDALHHGLIWFKI
jgi:hypothetical protein